MKITKDKRLRTEKVAKKHRSKPISLPPIVGIGASAGGLESIVKLIPELPGDTGFAFTIIMHLDPTAESDLAEILSRLTPMPVSQVKNGQIAKPNQIYTIPPNYDLILSSDGKYHVITREKKFIHMPIDIFFKSLAENNKEKSIGIVLSGTGSDGTAGLRAIREENGITFAQRPSSAKYDSMPNNAIRSGAVDTILTPKEIAKELARIATHPYVKPKLLAVSSKDVSSEKSYEDIPEEMTDELKQIINIIRRTAHFDFAHYKQGTINRRIKRRMVLRKINTLSSYIHYLEKHPEEVNALANDFLITVTRFFRDTEVFLVLKRKLLPQLIRNHTHDLPLRIWVPACSSGEEAYSIAILLMEIMEANGHSIPIRIFATDISEESLRRARTGFYPQGIEREVSKERLQRYFSKVEGGYSISKLIREQCIFSQHDLTRDPPFAKIDLISCRNLLIYFNTDLQNKVIPLLYYALNPTGMLVLGNSEAPTGFPDLFSPLDKKHRIFLKKEMKKIIRPMFQFSSDHKRRDDNDHPVMPFLDKKKLIQKEMDRLLLERYAPPSVLVNLNMDVIMTRGQISRYLQIPAGEPRLNIMKMASLELAMEIRKSLQAINKSGGISHSKQITLTENGQTKSVTLKIEELKTFPQMSEQYYLVEFPVTQEEKITQHKKISGIKSVSQSKKNKRHLKETLLAEQHYQLLMEQFEATQEQMVSSNEELQSSNEELQSSNEELETAKEELQSSNEELSTVNEELHLRNTEVMLLNKDLNNLITNIDIPIILVDDQGNIRNFTPSSSKLLKLIISDIGRPLGDITQKINAINLDDLVKEVMQNAQEKMIDIQDEEGYWHKLIVKPYQTQHDRIDGAIIIMLDINALKTAYEDAQIIIRALPTPVLLIDTNFEVAIANEAFLETFKMSFDKVIGHHIATLGNGALNIPELMYLIKKTIESASDLKNFEVEHNFPGAGRKTILLNAVQIHLWGSRKKAALLVIQDVSQRREIEYQKIYNRLNLALHVGKIGTWELDIENDTLKWDARMYEIYGVDPRVFKFSFEGWLDTIYMEDKHYVTEQINQFMKSGDILNIEYRIKLASGQIRYLQTRAKIIKTDNIVLGTTLDITEAKFLTNELMLERKKLLTILEDRAQVNKELESFAYIASHDLKAPLRGIQSLTTWIENDKKNVLSRDSKENLRLLRRRVTRMSNLIGGILDYSRAGQIDLKLSVVNVKKLLDEVIETLNPSNTITFRYSKNLPTFKTAALPLSQVFSNLISNAIKYCNPKQGVIEIGMRDHKDFYEFSVVDNGKGIKKEYHDKIFQLFQTLESKDIFESTGIGLSIVKKIVELNHGKISVKSAVGKGATFRFTWPKYVETSRCE